MASKYRARWRKYSSGPDKDIRKGIKVILKTLKVVIENFVVYKVLLMKKNKKKKKNTN